MFAVCVTTIRPVVTLDNGDIINSNTFTLNKILGNE